jgi:hypothetical protein
MPPNAPERVCASCQGTNLVEGKMGPKRTAFHPAGRFMLLGYALSAVACLDCGFVGTRLTREQITEIREKRP